MWSLLENFGDTPGEAVASVATCAVDDRTPADVVELLRFWLGKGYVTPDDLSDGLRLARDAFERGPNDTWEQMARAVVVLSRVLR